MGLFVMVGGGLLICAAFYYFAAYVVPGYVGLAAFFWAVGTGAGLGSPFVGLAAGVVIFLLAYFALGSGRAWLSLSVLAVYVLAAFYAGYNILLEIGAGLVPSTIWRHVFAVAFAFAAGIAAFKGLIDPSFARKHLARP